jgi:putative ABC transport system permease protein
MRLEGLAWRGLAARPLRTVLAIIGIALGVAVVAATIIIGSASEQALQSATADLLGSADLRVRAFADGGFGPRAVQALRAQPGVIAASPVSERPVLTVSDLDDRVFTLLVLGIDPEVDAAIRSPSLESGAGLSSSSATDALVPASWARRNGLGIGDQLILTGHRTGVPPLRIVGLLPDSGFGALNSGEVLVAGREALDEAFELPSPIRYIDLDLAAGATRQQVDAVTEALDEPFVVETAADATARFASANESFIGVAFLFGLVALVVGAFLVGNTMAMTVGERTRDLALLRAAGTTTGQVRAIVLRQAAALGVAGSLLGILVGIGLAALMIGYLSSTRAVLLVGLPLPMTGLAAAFGLGLVVTFIGAIVPARRAARISPLAALRPSRTQQLGLVDRLRPILWAEALVVVIGIAVAATSGWRSPAAPVLLSLALLIGGAVLAAFVLGPASRFVGRPFEWFFGAQALLGRVNLSRDRVRTGLTVGAMMIALAAVVALGTVAESVRAATEQRVASLLPGGHAIRAGLALDVETFRPRFEETPGVAVVSPVLELPVVRATGAGPAEEAALAGIDPNLFADADALLIVGARRSDAFAALRGGGAVLVPESLADRTGIEVGDRIELGQPGSATTPLSVAGLVRYSLPARTPDGALLVSAADARDLFGADAASLWILVPQAGIPDSVFAAAVREKAAEYSADPLTPRDLAGDVARALERLGGLFDALALIAVAIGALGIVNTLGVSIGERVREIAILRSNGMTVGQVQAMVVTEAAIMGAIAGLLAVVTGLLVAVALVAAGGSDELTAGVRLPWALLVAILLTGTGVAALAGLYPARVAGTLPIVRHLKQFE